MSRSKPLKGAPALSAHVAEYIARAPHAGLVASSGSDRESVLAEIASLHTRKELLTVKGVGQATLSKIEVWLERHGRRFRRSYESIDSVICTFSFRRDVALGGGRRKHRRTQRRSLSSAFTI